MSALFKKLLRNIRQGKGQFLAVVAVVTIGIMVYVSMSSTYNNLTKAQEDFYRQANFADYYFMVVKAPHQVVKEVENIKGVKRATGRITLDLSILKEDNKRATARIVTYSLPMDNELNRLLLEEGRMFSERGTGSGIEIMTNPGFKDANEINWGDSIAVIYEGKPVYLTVVGTANSPEFVYPVKDITDIIPDHKNFGIFMLPQYEAGQVFNYEGQINQLLVEFTPDAEFDQVIENIKELLKPYGLLTSYPRDDQLSHAMLQAEFDSIRSLITTLPVIFLLIAAGIQFVILRRMVRHQRGQIGVLKALGYSNRHIIFHYTSYALLVGFLGALLGSLTGWMLSGLLTDYFLLYFNMPSSSSGFNLQAIINGFLLSMGVGGVAGWSASRQVAKIQPAESMRREAPKMGRKSIVEEWPYIWRKLGTDWKISLRNISRNRGRFALTTIGITLAVSLLVISYFMNDAVDYMMKSIFHDQKYDLLIRVSTPVKEGELSSIESIDGVLKVEPFLEIPIRINYKGKSEEDILIAYHQDMTLKRIADESGRELKIPSEGILLSHTQANKLGVSVGEEVEIETLLSNGPTHIKTIKVAGINHQMIGSANYADLTVANRLLEEKSLISGAMLKNEVGKTPLVEEKLNEMLNISSISSREKELANFESNLDALVYTVTLMVLFAMILGLAIVYNASLISFVEREKELAVLKVIGFSNKELAGILGKENLLQSLIGIAVGLPLGKYMAVAFFNSLDTDLYSFPVIIYPFTYVLSALSAVVFIIIAHRLAIRGIKRIDLVEALKNVD